MASTSTSVVVLGSLSSSYSGLNDARVVRFDNECVLIPEYSASRNKRPRVVTKSYSLPLWKRRPTQASDSDYTDESSQTMTMAPLSSSPEETHVVLRVPIPSFVRRTSPSRGSGRSSSTSPVIPLSPCLVYRTPSTPSSPIPSSPPPSTRRPSLPIYHRRPDDQTVPLRACCPNCVPITEECLKEGSSWKEKFSKGARRRRSASLDSTSTPIGGGVGVMASSPVGGKAAFVPGSYDEPMPPPTFALTVDEVDKRRKSLDGSIRSISPNSRYPHSHHTTRTTNTTTFNVHDRDHSIRTDIDSDQDASPKPDPAAHIPPIRKASPIAEEDENELFPLPSPRRSPSSSSAGSSPKISPKSSPAVSPKHSPAPSPSASSSCLHPSTAAVLAAAKSQSQSGESVRSKKEGVRLGKSTSEEKLTSNSGISRKGKEKDLLEGESGMDLTSVTTPGSGASTPRTGKPRPLSLTLALPTTHKSNDTSTDGRGGGDTVPNSPISPSAVFTSSSLSSISSPQPKSPLTPTSPRSMMGSGPNGGRKLSFTLPFLKAGEAIKGASVDVLKGVSSISGGMGGGV